MSNLPDELGLIQVEATRFRSAVSENMLQTIGKTANFLANRTYEEKQFFLNGRYGIVGSPQLGIDGLVFFEYNAVIINAWAFSVVPGSGGITELDIKRATTPGGTFTSIFTTTPKFTSASASYSWVDALGKVAPGTGVTAPVLDATQINVNAGDALRIDKLQAMTGTAENCGIIITFRSR